MYLFCIQEKDKTRLLHYPFPSLVFGKWTILLFATCILFFSSIYFTYPKKKKNQLELEGDAALVVAALSLQKDDDLSLWGAIIQETRYYLHSIPQTRIKHMWRGSNKVAHRLAQLRSTLEQRRVWFEEPPNVQFCPS
ncbi:unnamed protein product [Malus baccata var. baccata]